ncbi:nucleotidyltransferase domain-containing protein [Sulfurimonas sp.]|uniref:nucleotidyltransferase domain-containing protein n=1 Tax=Sulfurimonas sp. TaxID=2022749 RepID=UPI002B48DD0C|nr:CCA tRNA nucleotidyltransferase [Sulfurimonas sp.]
MIKYPNDLNIIFDRLREHNATIIIVGGYIRDFLLDANIQDSKDIDIEIYNISSYEKLQNILKEFGEVNNVGKSFGVCKLCLETLDLDFTLPRIDSKIASGHKGFDVKVLKDLNFKEASKRRDFTINAIGYNIATKEILDPHNGIADLKKKNLKMVDAKTFVQDPLRVLRAIQFCARFELKMDKELFLQCSKMIKQDMLLELPKERVYGEIKKLLLKSNKPSIGFELLNELQALEYFSKISFNFLSLDALAKENITKIKTKEILMLALICYKLNQEQTQDFISNLSNEKELAFRVTTLVVNLPIALKLSKKDFSDYELYKLATHINIEEINILLKVIYGVDKKIFMRAKELNILNHKLPNIIKGRDLIVLGLKESKNFKTILDAAYEAQMHNEFNSHENAKEWLLANYIRLSV